MDFRPWFCGCNVCEEKEKMDNFEKRAWGKLQLLARNHHTNRRKEMVLLVENVENRKRYLPPDHKMKKAIGIKRAKKLNNFYKVVDRDVVRLLDILSECKVGITQYYDYESAPIFDNASNFQYVPKYDNLVVPISSKTTNEVISVDMFSEEFNSLNWPFKLDTNPPMRLRLRGSNVVVDYRDPDGPMVNTLPDLQEKTELEVAGCVIPLDLDVDRETFFETHELNRDGKIFWVCPKSAVHMWDQVEKLLEKGEVSKPEKLKNNQMYVIKDQKEGKMHRAVTVALYGEVNEVYFVDRGVQAMVELKEIFEVNHPDLYSFPPLAVPLLIDFDSTDSMRNAPFRHKSFTSITPQRLRVVLAMAVEISKETAAYCGRLVIGEWSLPGLEEKEAIPIDPENSGKLSARDIS